MPNVAAALKEEIARVSRKTTKSEIDGLRKMLAQQRLALSALKRRADALERALSKGGRGERGKAEKVMTRDGEVADRRRFSAKGFAKLRQRLGISAAAMGQLLGASSLSVYKWESGKTHPRAKQVEKIVAIRGLGKREVQRRLGSSPSEPGAGAPEKGRAPRKAKRLSRSSRAASQSTASAA